MYTITWRVASVLGGSKDIEDFGEACKDEAVDLYEALKGLLSEENDRVVFYRIKGPYQDPRRTSVMDNEGNVISVLNYAPRTWQEARGRKDAYEEDRPYRSELAKKSRRLQALDKVLKGVEYPLSPSVCKYGRGAELQEIERYLEDAKAGKRVKFSYGNDWGSGKPFTASLTPDQARKVSPKVKEHHQTYPHNPWEEPEEVLGRLSEVEKEDLAEDLSGLLPSLRDKARSRDRIERLIPWEKKLRKIVREAEKEDQDA